MIRFRDFLLGSPLPLHRSLLGHKRLSIALKGDGEVCGETNAMNGNPKTGVWKINSTIAIPKIKQSLTIVVIAHEGRIKIQLASVTLSVRELVSQVKTPPNGYHGFIIGNFRSVQFLITCLVEPDGASITRVPSTSPSNSVLPMQIHRLGREQQERFNYSGDITDLEGAIRLYYNALTLVNYGDPGRLSVLSSLGTALRRRFESFGSIHDISDVQQAISLQQQAVDLTPEGHPERAARLGNLGNAIKARYGVLGKPADFEDAMSCLRKAADLLPEDSYDRPGAFSNIGSTFFKRFEHTGALADLDNGIENLRKALEVTPEHDPIWPTIARNYATALDARIKRMGLPVDIEDAISVMQKAVALTPDDHSAMPRLLTCLGCVLEQRFSNTGNLADINNAISSLQKAVALTPDDHSSNWERLCDLGACLQARFRDLGGLTDIENAILTLQKAVEVAPHSHPLKPGLLNNLGNALVSRFERLNRALDLENAISILRTGEKLMPEGHTVRPTLLNTLGLALLRRVNLTRNTNGMSFVQANTSSLGHQAKLLQAYEKDPEMLIDVRDLVNTMQEAVELTPDGDPEKQGRLTNLGMGLQTRFEILHSVEDINNAISMLQKASEMTSEGHPHWPGRLNNVAHALMTRFDRLRAPEDLENALQYYSRAATSKTGRVMSRFLAARAWAHDANTNSRSPIPAFSCIISLLPQLAWLGLAVTDQHALLADFGGIVRNAVAAAIKWEEYELAVAWADQGRSIVWQNMLGLRTPLDDLRVAHPNLADRIQYLSRRMESPPSDDTVGGAQKSLELATEWENTVKETRKLPGFEAFLRPKTFDQLSLAARQGPVAILNVDESQCDALVLVPDETEDNQVSVISIPLTRFSYKKSQKLCEKLSSLLVTAGVRARGDIRKSGRAHPEGSAEATFGNILRVLWLDVVQPVVDALAYQANPEHLPRIWWCATGSLAFLPIHAAGIYGPGGGEKLSDYVVSSYTPTLTAILEQSPLLARGNFQILTVSQPSTPYATPIPGTEDEIKQVRSLAGGVSVVSLKNKDATVERVLEEMKNANWIHLACHGQQCTGDPMKSGLLLHDRILELSEIVKSALPKADFAFLSACQTATGDERIADESVHLAAGMFMAGYRSVIATMWSIRDSDAPQIAEDVYRRILEGGRPNGKDAAHALHEAVKRLRESGAGFMSWVPFIHIGR